MVKIAENFLNLFGWKAVPTSVCAAEKFTITSVWLTLGGLDAGKK